MPELALHFTVPAGTDPAAAAAALEQQLAGVSGVEAADARADQQRFVGPQEVVVVLTTATALVTATAAGAEASAKLIEALRHVVEQAKQLAKACGLGGGRLEAGMQQVPLDHVTDRDLHEAAAGG